MANRGRPTKYDPAYCEEIIKYFDKPPQKIEYKREYNNDGSIRKEEPIILGNDFPSLAGFAAFIGVNQDTIFEWAKVHKDFSEAISRAKAIQENIWLINGLSGQYNSQFAQFFGKNCLGYKDKTDVSVEQSGPFEVKITVD